MNPQDSIPAKQSTDTVDHEPSGDADAKPRSIADMGADGKKRTRFRWLKTDPLIFFASVGFILAFVVFTVVMGDTAREAYSTASGWVTTNLGWLFIGGVSAALVFLIGVFLFAYGIL